MGTDAQINCIFQDRLKASENTLVSESSGVSIEVFVMSAPERLEKIRGFFVRR